MSHANNREGERIRTHIMDPSLLRPKYLLFFSWMVCGCMGVRREELWWYVNPGGYGSIRLWPSCILWSFEMAPLMLHRSTFISSQTQSAIRVWEKFEFLKDSYSEPECKDGEPTEHRQLIDCASIIHVVVLPTRLPVRLHAMYTYICLSTSSEALQCHPQTHQKVRSHSSNWDEIGNQRRFTSKRKIVGWNEQPLPECRCIRT